MATGNERVDFDISQDQKTGSRFRKEAMATAGKDFHLFISPWESAA